MIPCLFQVLPFNVAKPTKLFHPEYVRNDQTAPNSTNYISTFIFHAANTTSTNFFNPNLHLVH